ncbi:MAG: hypothetical protein B6247_04010 [Candidatus Parabeggiatoa sp. nov. 2]|nr:MAG: hypothetical protein B6247_04010 [Beggiatoa sp. 4572_84]
MDVNPIVEILNSIFIVLPFLLIAVLGGIVSLFINGRTIPQPYLGAMGKRVIIASFAGLIAFFLLRDIATSDNVMTAICGLAGFAAVDILPLLKGSFLKNIYRSIIMKRMTDIPQEIEKQRTSLIYSKK